MVTGSVAVNADTFREGLAPRHFTNVECIGNETSLFQCARTEFTGLSCATSGVVCQGECPESYLVVLS